MYQFIDENYKNGNQVLSKVTWYCDNKSVVLSVAGTVLGSLPFDIPQIIGTVASIEAAKYSAISKVLNMINKKFKTTASDLKYYFASLNTAMENTKDVVMMKIRYRFTKEYLTRYIDAHQTYRITDETVYSDDIITSYEHLGSCMNGKVYGISSMDDLEEMTK